MVRIPTYESEYSLVWIYKLMKFVFICRFLSTNEQKVINTDFTMTDK